MQTSRGYLFILLAALLWGMIGPLARLAFAEGVLPMEVALWRALFSWALFGVQAILQRQIRVRTSDLPALTLFGFTGVTIFYGAYQLAVRQGGAALASVLLYTAPAWVVLLSRVFFKERFTPVKMFALAGTLAGIVLISFGGSAGIAVTPTAIGFGLLSGFSYSLYYIFGKYFSERYSASTLFLYILPIGIAGLLPLVSYTPKTPTAWLALFCLAFFCTYGAYHLYYIGLKYLEAGRAAIAATLEPVVAGVVAYFWWQERFTTGGYIGSFLIILAVVMMIRDRQEGPTR
jgi:DME family drug/metabolite transporter